jgi:hypothetical protein
LDGFLITRPDARGFHDDSLAFCFVEAHCQHSTGDIELACVQGKLALADIYEDVEFITNQPVALDGIA